MSSLKFTLGEIAQATGGQIISGDAASVITEVVTDTRRLSGSNDLFVALRGQNHDGHNFLERARAAGARAVLIDDSSNLPADLPAVRVESTLKAFGDLARAHRRRFELPVIAITGSYGKTTTRALTAQAMSPKFSVLSSEGNFNNEIGVPLSLLNLCASHEAVVLELAMRGLGHIKYLTDIALPNIGVITNIGPQHIGLLGSLDNIARAKAELVTALPPDGLAVLPADDRYIDFLRWSTTCRIVTFGTREADYQVKNARVTGLGRIVFSLVTSSGQQIDDIKIPVGGRFNALNAAAALAVAGELGVELEKAANAIQNAQIPSGRMRTIVNEAHAITIIEDCYNAGPYSMRAALEALRDYPAAKRRIAVLGEMAELGQWSESEHRSIGSLASKYVEFLIGVGKDAHWIIEGLCGKVRSKWYANSAAAADCIRNLVATGDVVLVKGSRRVQMERIIDSLVSW